MRIVSLLPSATEIICALIDNHSDHHLVARSHECDWPPSLTTSGIPSLTAARTTFQSSAQIDADVRAQLASGQSLYTLDTDQLAALKPDLVVTQDLCEVCSIDMAAVQRAAANMHPRPAVLSLNPKTFEGVLDDILSVGAALHLERRALDLVVSLRERMDAAENHVNPFADKPSVAFLEWTDPLFVGGHWTPQLIERAGGAHPLNPTIPMDSAGAAAGPIGQTLRRAGKSIRIAEEALIASRPDYLIICPCGLSLEAAQREAKLLAQKTWWRDLPAVRNNRIAIVDGNHMFNRPGPRLIEAFEFLVGYLNHRPDMIPAGFPWA